MPIMFNPCQPCCRKTSGTADIFTMNWTDEDSYYNIFESPSFACQFYSQDKASYEALLLSEPSLLIKGGMMMPVGTGSAPYLDFIRCPPGTDFPTGISATTCNRDTALTVSEIITFFNSIRGDTKPKFIGLVVDNSGSMTTGNIQPAYNNFKSWLNTTYAAEVGDTITIREISTQERWIYELIRITENLIQDLKDGL